VSLCFLVFVVAASGEADGLGETLGDGESLGLGDGDGLTEGDGESEGAGDSLGEGEGLGLGDSLGITVGVGESAGELSAHATTAPPKVVWPITSIASKLRNRICFFMMGPPLALIHPFNLCLWLNEAIIWYWISAVEGTGPLPEQRSVTG
jgi:hypothetical protein